MVVETIPALRYAVITDRLCRQKIVRRQQKSYYLDELKKILEYSQIIYTKWQLQHYGDARRSYA